MKKAKIMLAALSVLAVVGSTLAFKASTYGANIYTENGYGQCNKEFPGHTVTNNPNAPLFIGVTITPSYDPCPSSTFATNWP